jgi:hypothetical protein
MVANDAWLKLPKSTQWHEVQPNEAQDLSLAPEDVRFL